MTRYSTVLEHKGVFGKSMTIWGEILGALTMEGINHHNLNRVEICKSKEDIITAILDNDDRVEFKL